MFDIHTPHFIARLTFTEIRRRLAVAPSIIVPVASMEPFGEVGAVGASAVCCVAIADRLSEKTGILLSAPLLYGHSTPYRAFAGCAGAKHTALESLVVSIAKDFSAQGCRTLYLVDGSYEGSDALGEASRAVHSRRLACETHVLSWQHDDTIRAHVAKRCGAAEPARCEYGILSMAATLDPLYVRAAAKPGTTAKAGESTGRAWRKRGRDPEKYRKLFPDGLTSQAACAYDAAFGTELLDRITAHFAAQMQQTESKRA